MIGCPVQPLAISAYRPWPVAIVGGIKQPCTVYAIRCVFLIFRQEQAVQDGGTYSGTSMFPSRIIMSGERGFCVHVHVSKYIIRTVYSNCPQLKCFLADFCV